MALEISGKVLQLLAEQTGNGKNGTWVRRDFVIETTEQYPKKICFSGWGDKAGQVNALKPGQTVKVSFNPESREFNGKWYTDLRAWKIEAGGGTESAHYENEVPDFSRNQPDSPSGFESSSENTADDLPF
jgi:hypothetical protein